MDVETNTEEYLPPGEAPSLLTFDQVRHLATHGWLQVRLQDDFLREIDRLFVEGDTFFEESTTSKLSRYPPSHGTECGYYEVPGEKEYITFRHEAHEGRPGSELQSTAATVWHSAAHLLHRILSDLSRAGGLPVNIWDELVEGSLTMPRTAHGLATDISLMRLFHYHGPSTRSESVEGLKHDGDVDDTSRAPSTVVGAPAHVDTGLLTLCVGREPGLEVEDRITGEWRREDGIGGSSAATILIGDAARVLLRNRVRAGRHRVVVTASDEGGGRASVVFALRPRLVGQLNMETWGGEKGKVEDMREWFNRIKGPKYNVNAVKAVREKQLAEQRERRSKYQEDMVSYG